MKNSRLYFWIFITMLIVYVVLAIGLPPDPKALDRYHLTSNGARLLSLTIVVPVTVIYLTSLYGFVRMREYAHKIRKTKEGKPFHELAVGLTILAFGLPIAAVFSSLLNYFSYKDASLLPTATIIKNYITLIFTFVSFVWIARGSKNLVGTLPHKKEVLYSQKSLFAVIILASTYTWLITTRPVDIVGSNPYYLPNWLIVLTLVVPYLYIWCIGIKAAYELLVYRRRVKGNLYKSALTYIANGVGAIISLSILLQFITTMAGRLNRLDLGPLLFTLYVLVACYAVGYVLVAKGAKRLKKIEEV